MPAPRRPTTTAFEPVRLGDLEVAQRIAQLSASAEPRQRVVPVAQLLAAFGEREPTDEAMERVRAALRMAGVVTIPDFATADPAAKVELRPPRRAAAAAAGGAASAALQALRSGKAPGPLPPPVAAALLAVVLLVFVLIASTINGGEEETQPLASTTLPRSTAATATTATTAPPATTAEPVVTEPTVEEAEQEEAERRARARRARERRARERERRARARERARKSKSFVGLRLVPRDPGYVCVVGPNRKVLYDGILDEPRVFKEKRLRVIVQGPQIRVNVDGDAIQVRESPEGFSFGLEQRNRVGTEVAACDGPPNRGASAPPGAAPVVPGTAGTPAGAGVAAAPQPAYRPAPAPQPPPPPPPPSSPQPASGDGSGQPMRPPPGDATGGG